MAHEQFLPPLKFFSMNPLDKLPNASQQAEAIVLSCMMQDPANCCPDVLSQVGPEAFRGVPGHRTIAEVIFSRFMAQQSCDLISVQQHLIDQNLLDAAGGVANLTEIAIAAPTPSILQQHLADVRRKAFLLKIWQTCHDVMVSASQHADEGNPDGMLDDVERAFYNLRSTFQRQDEQLQHAKVFAEAAVNQLEAAYKARGSGVLGVPTGFYDLDRMLNGMKAGQLIILAARPSVGKSALAMNILQNAAGAGHGCALFSLEMSGLEMLQRMLCSDAGISLKATRDGFLGKADFPKITTSFTKVAGQNIWIDETPSLSLYQLRAKARRLKMQHGIGFIVIDYLQLMRCPSKRGDANRALEIADITGGLKTLAKELEIPIIALAQLNRDAERRNEPKLSDLRESGSIEQDADVVLLMSRDKENPDIPTQLFVAKQRNGPVGSIELGFNGELTRFTNITQSAYSNNSDSRQKNYKN